MKHTVTLMLIVAAIIHLLPLSGVLGSERLTVLYGISFEEPNIEILMRHRAVLFGMLGIFFLYAAFNSAYQLVALLVGMVSVISFLIIAWSVEGYNTEVSHVLAADLLALVCLAVGLFVNIFQRRSKI